MNQYRKLPVVIEAWAVRELLHAAKQAWSELPKQVAEAYENGDVLFGDSPPHILIKTLEGWMRGDLGDWLIKGVKNELYPCKPDIFAATYESALEQRHAAGFVDSFNAIASDHHCAMVSKKFWEGEQNVSEKLMLVVTEVAEACEAQRHGNPPDDKVPEFTGLEAELSDVILRIMDMAQGYKLRVAEALLAKMEYNRSRPEKHGKAF